jgi:hypothetical protein
VKQKQLLDDHRSIWLGREDQDCLSFFRSSFLQMKYQTTSHRTLRSRAINAYTIGFLCLEVRKREHKALRKLPQDHKKPAFCDQQKAGYFFDKFRILRLFSERLGLSVTRDAMTKPLSSACS